MVNLRVHSCEKCGCCAAPGFPALCPDCIAEMFTQEQLQEMADFTYDVEDEISRRVEEEEKK